MNMSYCRFENTLGDLQDCYEALMDPTDELSERESKKADDLIALCQRIALEFGDEE